MKKNIIGMAIAGAEGASLPTLPRKKVSTRLKREWIKFPAIMGRARRKSSLSRVRSVVCGMAYDSRSRRLVQAFFRRCRLFPAVFPLPGGAVRTDCTVRTGIAVNDR